MALSAEKVFILALIGFALGQDNATDLPTLEEITTQPLDYTNFTNTMLPDSTQGREDTVVTTEPTTPDSTLELSTQSVPSSSTKNSSIDDMLPEGFKFNRSELELGHFCTCDLTQRSCDVNCCCDIDCSIQDIKVFSECKVVKPNNLSPRYCYKTEIVVDNNTQYLMEKVDQDNPLFCITNANMKEGFTYIDREPIENVTYFEEMKSRHKAFAWSSTSNSAKESPSFNASYKAGDPIIVITDDQISHLSLPVPIFGSRCSAFSTVLFLGDEEYSCNVVLEDFTDCTAIPEINAVNYVAGFRVLKSLNSLINNSIDDVAKMTQELVIVKPEVCINLNHEETVCVETKLNEALSEPTKACENVLTKLKYEIYHGGVEGIISIKALVEMTNFSQKLGEKIVVSQTFGYTHYWATENQTTILEARSGNPGYIVGKPILAGVLSHKDSESFNDESTMSSLIQSDLLIDRGYDEMSQFLTIMSPTSANSCNRVQRQKIQFGINTRVGCVIFKTRKELSKSCHHVRKEALDTLVGSQMSLKRNRRNGRNSQVDYGLELLIKQRVASFGNSKSTNPQDWIKVGLTNVPSNDEASNIHSSNNAGGCKDVVTSMHIDIYYANVGSHANPQAKIIGVHCIFATPKDIFFNCHALNCRQPNLSQPIEISTSVAFLDMTQPALEFFREKPVLEAKLPHDFFYPFVYSPSEMSSSSSPQIKCNVKFFRAALFFLLYKLSINV